MDQKMIDALRVISSVPQTQADINKHNYEQNLPAQKLATYMASLQGGQLGQQSSGSATQPVYSDPLARGMGIASSAAGIGSTMMGGKG